MTTKAIILKNSIISELTFEEVHEQFFNSIQNEAWKMKSKYGNSVNIDELIQQFTIELWNAYNKYDVSLGYHFSTYAYHRFNKARRDILQERFLSRKAEWNESVVSIDKQLGNEENSKAFSNQEFMEDEQYMQYKHYQPDVWVEEQELFNRIKDVLNSDEERELIVVLLDRKSYSVNDYAEKYNISRQAANKRLLSVKKKIKSFLENEIGGNI